MAFTTTVGAGGTSLIGTSGVDTVALNPGTVAAPLYIGAQADADIVTFVTNAVNTAAVELGKGADILNANTAIGTSTMRGNDGNDTLNVGANLTNSIINGNGGTDTVNIGTITIATATIHGGQGDDTIATGLGNALTFSGGRINGNIGNDTITVALAANMSASAATINGGQGADVITVTTGFNAVVSGDNDNDVLTTNAGNDTLYGGGGQDLIAGGLNADTMVGGDGVDTFTPLSGATTAFTAGFITTGAAVTSGAGVVTGAAANFNTQNITAIQVGTGTSAAARAAQGNFDVITDFTAGVGGDRVDVSLNTVAGFNFKGAAGLGTTLAAAGFYAISGTYSSSTGIFTIASTASNGADTLIVGLGPAGTTVGESVVLRGVNATQVVATNLV